MEIRLTNDADALICLIYKEFLARHSAGHSKRQAKDFSDKSQWPKSFFAYFHEDDISDTLPELKRAGMIRMDIFGGFRLEDAAIIYMESRFKRGVSEVIEHLVSLKSLIPFV